MLYIVGAYTAASIYDNGRLLVPSYLCLLASIATISVHHSSLPWRAYMWAAVISGVVLLHSVLVLLWVDSGSESVRASVNLLYSLVLTATFYRALRGCDERTLRPLFGGIAALILILAIAERYLGLDVLSNYFRRIIYPSSLYIADHRDVLLYGGIRPKVFTLEPSYVALYFSLFLSAWLLSAPPRVSSMLGAVMATGLAIYVMRSPIAAYAMYGAAITLIMGSAHAQSRLAWTVFVSAAVIFIPPLGLGYIASLAPDSFLGGASLINRFSVPFVIASNSIVETAIGYGLAADVTLFRQLVDTSLLLGVSEASGIGSITSGSALLANSFFYSVISFGLLGGVAFWLATYKYMRVVGSTWPLAGVAISATFLTLLGGLVTVQVWFIFAIIARSLDLRASHVSTDARLTLAASH